MATLLDAGLDLVTGSSCVACSRPGRLLCARCARTLPTVARPARPRPCPSGLAVCRVAGDYAEPLRALILAHKERRAFALARPLGAVLAVVVEDLLADLVVDDPSLSVLVPVPSRRRVVRARGQDPMLRITRVAAQQLRQSGARVTVLPILRQRRAVADQAALGISGRLDNLRDSMAAEPAALRALARERVPVAAVVCDDVLTTGATAREAQRALEDVGVTVTGIAALAATQRRLLFTP